MPKSTSTSDDIPQLKELRFLVPTALVDLAIAAISPYAAASVLPDNAPPQSAAMRDSRRLFLAGVNARSASTARNAGGAQITQHELKMLLGS